MNTKRSCLLISAVWWGLLMGAATGQDRSAAAVPQRTRSADANSGSVAPATPVLEVRLETSAAPELAPWAERARSLCKKNYPLIIELLGAPGFDPPRKVTIVLKDMKGVAYTSGSTITCAAAYFKAHPNDYGAVVHELCHVVQAYGGKKVPGWVTEGIADYVRWFHFEPPSRRPHVNAKTAKYTDGYRNTAALLDWICRTKDPTFVTRLNRAARNGEYRDELFVKFAGKPVDQLWAEFIKSQPADSPQPRSDGRGK